MRENRYDKLLLVSIIVLIVSGTLLIISAYNVYFKNTTTPVANNAMATSANTSKIILRDSLNQVYTSTIKEIDNELPKLDAVKKDSLVAIQLGEVVKLREEIVLLLADKNNNDDLEIAKVKIIELQQKVTILQNRYSGVESENRRLQKLIAQLMEGKQLGKIASVTNDIKNKIPTDKKNKGSMPSTGGLHLFAVVNNSSNGQETSIAEAAEKMVGTFVVKNLPAKGIAELLIVVLQPDGRVVKNSVWESGTFETAEGKKIYSRKIVAESTTDEEEKQLNFSLTPERFLKGDYTMQIWYNGSMIGKMVKTLS